MANESSSLSSDLMSPDADDEKSQVVGRQIWRIVPYAKRYPKRVVAGITSNAMARVFDLMPFVAIGYAIYYFTTKEMSAVSYTHLTLPTNREV